MEPNPQIARIIFTKMQPIIR